MNFSSVSTPNIFLPEYERITFLKISGTRVILDSVVIHASRDPSTEGYPCPALSHASEDRSRQTNGGKCHCRRFSQFRQMPPNLQSIFKLFPVCFSSKTTEHWSTGNEVEHWFFHCRCSFQFRILTAYVTVY